MVSSFAVKGDVGSEADIMAMFEAVDRRYGRRHAPAATPPAP